MMVWKIIVVSWDWTTVFLINMDYSFRVWKVQIETPNSSGLVHQFGSSDSYLVTAESTASTIDLCEE